MVLDFTNGMKYEIGVAEKGTYYSLNKGVIKMPKGPPKKALGNGTLIGHPKSPKTKRFVKGSKASSRDGVITKHTKRPKTKKATPAPKKSRKKYGK